MCIAGQWELPGRAGRGEAAGVGVGRRQQEEQAPIGPAPVAGACWLTLDGERVGLLCDAGASEAAAPGGVATRAVRPAVAPEDTGEEFPLRDAPVGRCGSTAGS